MSLSAFTSFQIVDARDCPEHIDAMLEWQRLQWGDQWVSHIQQQASARPFGMYAAITNDGNLAGCVLLLGEEMGVELSPFPWICGLVVSPRHRRRGLGSSLICHVKNVAKHLGFLQLNLKEVEGHGMYEALGWEFSERVQLGDCFANVFTTSLMDDQESEIARFDFSAPISLNHGVFA